MIAQREWRFRQDLQLTFEQREALARAFGQLESDVLTCRIVGYTESARHIAKTHRGLVATFCEQYTPTERELALREELRARVRQQLAERVEAQA